MDYLVFPIGWLLKLSFEYILVPIGELPDIINPNYIFLFIGFIGLFYWLRLQSKFNRQAKERGTLK